MPHAVACTKAGLMSFDTKRPYDEGHLYAGLTANNAKAYSNAEAYDRGCTRGHAQVNAHEPSQSVDNVWGEKCSNDEQCNCAKLAGMMLMSIALNLGTFLILPHHQH